ncbi:MAG: HepT-like ribonuclease domain-containing protein [Rickettsiales bacterium]|nr:HepT-like ribonuclease domain-containing protein [Rickettsiales bacterium]
MDKINSDQIRLEDIIKSINEIEDFAKSGFEDRKTIMAIAYSIAIIGEAANKLSSEVINLNNEIPWKQIIGMRHRIIHNYGNVDIKNLKQVVLRDLPNLRPRIESILKQISSDYPKKRNQTPS